jgi:hypothetical protein
MTYLWSYRRFALREPHLYGVMFGPGLAAFRLGDPAEGATITGYQAGPGWNPVTGCGTPDAQVLVPLLARS